METIARSLTASWKQITTQAEADAINREGNHGGMAQCHAQDARNASGARWYAMHDALGRHCVTARIGGGRLPPGPGGAEMTARDGTMVYATGNADPFVLHAKGVALLAKTLGVEIGRDAHVPIPGKETQRRLGGLLPGRLVEAPGANPIEERIKAETVDREERRGDPAFRRFTAAAGIDAYEANTSIVLTLTPQERPRLLEGGIGGGATVTLASAVPEAVTPFDEMDPADQGRAHGAPVRRGPQAIEAAYAEAGQGLARVRLDLATLAAHCPDAASAGRWAESIERVVAKDEEVHERTTRLAEAAHLDPHAAGVRIAATREDLTAALHDPTTDPGPAPKTSATANLLKTHPAAIGYSIHVRGEDGQMQETGEIVRGTDATKRLLGEFGAGRTRTLTLDLETLARTSDPSQDAMTAALLSAAFIEGRRAPARSTDAPKRDAGMER